jgi:alcohol dehydrogenase (cytochrome c)
VVLFEYKDPKTGKLVKASAHADRNGFFFVTDREKLATGAGYPNKPTSLIGAWPFVDGITWAKGFDVKTGKPIENRPAPPQPKPGADKGESVFVSPPFLGGTNWMPMSYSPQTGLFYIPANHWAMDYWTEKLTYKAGSAYLGRASASSACSTTTWAPCARWTRRPARSPGNTRRSPCGPAPSPPPAGWCSPAPPTAT